MPEVSVACAQCGDTFIYEKGRGRLRRYCSNACRNIRYYGRPETVKPEPGRACKGCDGPHAPANVQCSHLACNIAKGAAGQGEQLALVG